MQLIRDHKLTPIVSGSAELLGSRAGKRAASRLRSVLRERGHARLMLAAAESQAETLKSLLAEPDVDWNGVECFHMDDYLELPADAPQRFSNWLQATVFDKLPPSVVFHRIRPDSNGEQEANRYEALMGTEPFDLVLLGLGVTGHLAFNDPPTDLSDPRGVRVVSLSHVSRQQQVDEGHFTRLEDVPKRAITVTIPRLLNSTEVIASVPGSTKRQAVIETLTMPIASDHPGTALRMHPNVSLYVDSLSDPSSNVDVDRSSKRGAR